MTRKRRQNSIKAVKEPKSVKSLASLPEPNNETTAPCDTLSLASSALEDLRPDVEVNQAENAPASDKVWMKSSKGRNRKRSVKCKYLNLF